MEVAHFVRLAAKVGRNSQMIAIAALAGSVTSGEDKRLIIAGIPEGDSFRVRVVMSTRGNANVLRLIQLRKLGSAQCDPK